MANDWPILVLALTIGTYWGTVCFLVIYKRIRYGQRTGVVPRHGREKRLWWGFVPVVGAWMLLPTLAVFFQDGLFGLPSWANLVPLVHTFRSVVAVLAVACYLGTLSCWLMMGRSWSMAIVPNQKTELVTGGLFGIVRHPIYSLSILLMICSAVVVSNVPMLLVAVVHVFLMNSKAKNEEGYLTATHGTTYRNYCAAVGRFVPRLRATAVR